MRIRAFVPYLCTFSAPTPMRRLFASAALILAVAGLALVGCREAVVEPEPIVEPEPVQNPPADVARLYIKGGATMRLFAQGDFRAEAADGAARYDWVASGDGDLAGTPTGEAGRLQRFRAVREGPLTLVVRARDAEGRVIGEGRREMAVVR